MINCKVKKYSAAENNFLNDEKLTSVENFLEVFLNGEKFSDSFCSTDDIEDLIVGTLAQADKIRSVDDVVKISVDAKNSVAEVITTEEAILWAKSFAGKSPCLLVKDIFSCTAAPIFKKPGDIRFVAKDILNCADELLSSLAATHAKTNGVHIGAIFDQTEKKILVVREDIGRHNVFDKLYGWSISNRIDLTDKIIVFSGRCSCEMILKLARMRIPAVLAKSVPTTLSIGVAEKFGITLAGRMAKGSFCIYTNPQRIVLSWEG